LGKWTREKINTSRGSLCHQPLLQRLEGGSRAVLTLTATQSHRGSRNQPRQPKQQHCSPAAILPLHFRVCHRHRNVTSFFLRSDSFYQLKVAISHGTWHDY